MWEAPQRGDRTERDAPLTSVGNRLVSFSRWPSAAAAATTTRSSESCNLSTRRSTDSPRKSVSTNPVDPGYPHPVPLAFRYCNREGVLPETRAGVSRHFSTAIVRLQTRIGQLVAAGSAFSRPQYCQRRHPLIWAIPPEVCRAKASIRTPRRRQASALQGVCLVSRPPDVPWSAENVV